MCYIANVFHLPCKHWGRDQFIGGPCCRTRYIDGIEQGCFYEQHYTIANSDEFCHTCAKEHRNMFLRRPDHLLTQARLNAIVAKATARRESQDSGYYSTEAKPVKSNALDSAIISDTTTETVLDLERKLIDLQQSRLEPTTSVDPVCPWETDQITPEPKAYEPQALCTTAIHDAAAAPKRRVTLTNAAKLKTTTTFPYMKGNEENSYTQALWIILTRGGLLDSVLGV